MTNNLAIFINSDRILDYNNQLVLVDTSLGNVTVYLPDLRIFTATQTGFIYYIKKTTSDSNTIIVKSISPIYTIEGGTSSIISVYKDCKAFKFDNKSNYALVSIGDGGVVPAALTKVDDTNVTLSLGGTPSTALLQPVSLTLGWTGELSNTRGGTGLSSYTQGDILYYDSSTTLSKLAKNTSATRYLSNTGTSNNPAWAQIDLTNGTTGILPSSQGGNWVLISTTIASGASTVDFTGLNSTYKVYVIEYYNYTVSANSTNMNIRVGTGAGPTYQTGNVYNAIGLAAFGNSSTAAIANAATTSINITTSGTGANDVGSGEIWIHNPSQTTSYHQLEVRATIHRAAFTTTNMSHGTISAEYISTTAVTAIRIFQDSGTLSGTFYLYGIQ